MVETTPNCFINDFSTNNNKKKVLLMIIFSCIFSGQLSIAKYILTTFFTLTDIESYGTKQTCLITLITQSYCSMCRKCLLSLVKLGRYTKVFSIHQTIHTERIRCRHYISSSPLNFINVTNTNKQTPPPSAFVTLAV